MRQRFFSLFIAVTVSIGTMFAENVASGTCGENLTWSLDEKGTLTISGSGPMTDYTGESNSPWYSQRALIKEVIIQEDVASIGRGAFYDCTGLTAVTIGNSVTEIGKEAFDGCTGLTAVTIPNSVTSIGNYAFRGCTGLTSVTIGNSVTSIGDYAFKGCTGLTSVTIGNSVTSIGWHAFDGCSGLTTITIPNSVTSIGGYAFSGCTGLTNVTIGTNVQKIEPQPFDSCTNITSVIWNAKNCERIYFGSQVTSFTFGEQVETIPSSCCYGMSKLTSIRLPNSVKSVGRSAFYGCSGLNDPIYNDYLFAFMPENYEGDYNIKEGIETICPEAFRGCSKLTKVTLPNSLKIIYDEAFLNCSSLTSFVIPDGVTTLGNGIFIGCYSIKTITIPQSVNTFIQRDGLSSFPFTGINASNDGFFVDEGALTAFIVDPENPIYTSKDGILYDKNMTKLLQFPCAKKDAYTIPKSVIYINPYAFYGNQVLTEITLPRDVRVIGEGAFLESTLEKIHLPEELVKIEAYAFMGCYNIKELSLGSKVKSIGEGAFSLDLNKCKSITCLAKQAPTLDENAFTIGKLTGTIFDGDWEDVAPSALTVYVTQESIGDYMVDEQWGQFTILPLQAQSADVTEVKVIPSETTADIAWPTVSGAASYELTIKDKNGDAICTLTFNAQGQLTTIAFAAPSRDRAPQQEQTVGFQFTVTGLTESTTYDYTIVSKDADGNVLDTQSGSFTTKGEEPTYYTVKFVDWDNTILKEQTVEQGQNATAPADPSREGYTFKGWDKEFTNVQSDLVVKAVYEKNSDEAIDDVNAENVVSQKVIRNGQLLILRNGEIYNAQGARVK